MCVTAPTFHAIRELRVLCGVQFGPEIQWVRSGPAESNRKGIPFSPLLRLGGQRNDRGEAGRRAGGQVVCCREGSSALGCTEGSVPTRGIHSWLGRRTDTSAESGPHSPALLPSVSTLQENPDTDHERPSPASESIPGVPGPSLPHHLGIRTARSFTDVRIPGCNRVCNFPT